MLQPVAHASGLIAPLGRVKYILTCSLLTALMSDCRAYPHVVRHMQTKTKGLNMAAIGDFFSWLFGTRTGVIALVLGGIVLFLIIAIILERRTRAIYKNHEKSEDDWDLFDDDDESGWSEFDSDNN